MSVTSDQCMEHDPSHLVITTVLGNDSRIAFFMFPVLLTKRPSASAGGDISINIREGPTNSSFHG